MFWEYEKNMKQSHEDLLKSVPIFNEGNACRWIFKGIARFYKGNVSEEIIKTNMFE